MAHTKETREDGLAVLVVSDMNRRLDPRTGKPLAARKFDDVIVHAKAIAEYYKIPMRDIGQGDNRIPGIWSMVHENTIGMRVNYNNEEKTASDRYVRKWEKIFNDAGQPIDTKETIVREDHEVETDDGMYVRLSELLEYAEANGWTKGGGRPQHAGPTQAAQVDVASIVAAVLAALGHSAPAQVDTAAPAQVDVEPKQRSPKQRAMDAWLAAGRPENADEWKATWIAEHSE
jgi:hypothetical protein